MINRLKVAFVGNPNAGKTALINKIAGTRLKVGNWPGVTVDKKEAILKLGEREIYLIDLPGVYSLTPFGIEEKITRDFLLNEKPDIIVNVVDSTNLERNLYLTTQLLELGIPTVIALNFWDEFRSLGYKLNIEEFERLLGVKAIPTVATKGTGIKELLKVISKNELPLPKHPHFGKDLEEFIKKVEKIAPDKFPKRWASLKLLEGDKLVERELTPEKRDILKEIRKSLKELLGDSCETIVASERYSFIKGILRKTLKVPNGEKRTLTDILDAIFLNRLLGIPIFLFMIYLVFKLTFDGSAPLIDWLDGFINDFIAKWTQIALSGTPSWFQSFIIDGLIGGIGTVLTFIPLLVFLYFFLALLEESGYMARAAFVMDKLMRYIGLPGKAFIPMIIGFGCNVPAIYATRTLNNEKERKLTALLIPFMSCGARLPIYALFTAVFFKEHQAEVVISIYLIGVLTAILVGLTLKRVFLKGEYEPFIMELPPYRIPTLRMIWQSISTRTGAFIKKAGTVVAATMVLLWALINLPYGAPPKETALGKTASLISPVFSPTGIKDWEAVAALIPGTIAKEVVVGALGQLYGTDREESTEEPKSSFLQDLKGQMIAFLQAIKDSLKAMLGSLKTETFSIETIDGPIVQALQEHFTPLSAFSYMVLCLLWIPCVVTIGAIYHEFGLKLTAIVLGLTTVIPYTISALIYNAGKLLGVE